MARCDVEFAIMPTRALRLACGSEAIFRVAVEHGDQLRIGSQVGHPPATNRDEPKVACLVEGPALKKFALRLVMDICEQGDGSNARRWRRQAPRLNLFRRWRAGERRRGDGRGLRRGGMNGCGRA